LEIFDEEFQRSFFRIIDVSEHEIIDAEEQQLFGLLTDDRQANLSQF